MHRVQTRQLSYGEMREAVQWLIDEYGDRPIPDTPYYYSYILNMKDHGVNYINFISIYFDIPDAEGACLFKMLYA